MEVAQVFSFGNTGGSRGRPQPSPKLVETMFGKRRAKQVSAGLYQTWAVLENGECVMWDANAPNYAFAELRRSKCKQVSCGQRISAVLLENGTIACSDDHILILFEDGQVRLCSSLQEDLTHLSAWRLLHFGGEPVTSIAVGQMYSAAVTSDGVLWTFGIGPLGHAINVKQDPVEVEAMKGMKVASVACGSFHMACVTQNGELYTWGSSIWNQLGHGDRKNTVEPRRVTALEGKRVVEVSCGAYHTAVRTDAGRVYTFGAGSQGALGHGDVSPQEIPRLVDRLVDRYVQHVACGWYHTVVIVGMDPNISLLRHDMEKLLHDQSDFFDLRVVLAARCPKLAALVHDDQAELYIDGMDHATLKEFLHFIYTDTTRSDIDADLLLNLLHTSVDYDFSLLEKRCIEQFKDQLGLDNVLARWKQVLDRPVWGSDRHKETLREAVVQFLLHEDHLQLLAAAGPDDLEAVVQNDPRLVSAAHDRQIKRPNAQPLLRRSTAQAEVRQDEGDATIGGEKEEEQEQEQEKKKKKEEESENEEEVRWPRFVAHLPCAFKEEEKKKESEEGEEREGTGEEAPEEEEQEEENESKDEKVEEEKEEEDDGENQDESKEVKEEEEEEEKKKEEEKESLVQPEIMVEKDDDDEEDHKKDDSADVVACTFHNDLRRLVKNPQFADVTLAVEGELIPAHKAILCGRSEHFRAMFTSGMKESTDATIEVQDITLPVFNALLDYLYSGTAEITEDTVVELLMVANLYTLTHLQEQCECYVEKGIYKDNAAYILEMAHRFQTHHLRTIAMNYMLQQRDHVVRTEGFQELSPELLKEFKENVAFAKNCTATGTGAAVAYEGETAFFKIEAKDEFGNKCVRGDESFKVQILEETLAERAARKKRETEAKRSARAAARASKEKEKEKEKQEAEGQMEAVKGERAEEEEKDEENQEEKKENQEEKNQEEKKEEEKKEEKGTAVVEEVEEEAEAEVDSDKEEEEGPFWVDSRDVQVGEEDTEKKWFEANDDEFWICNECSLLNSKSRNCAACDTARPMVTKTGSSKWIRAIHLLGNNEGSYLASYVPLRAGRYSIHITLGDEPISGSPFFLRVARGYAAAECTAEGEGLKRAEVNVEVGFTIQGRDMFGRPLRTGGKWFLVRLTTKEDDSYSYMDWRADKGVVTDNNDGTYTVRYSLHQVGTFFVSVLLGHMHISGSPFTVKSYSTVPSAQHCVAFGEGLQTAVVGRRTAFTIQAKDKWNSPLDNGGHKFLVIIKKADQEQQQPDRELEPSSSSSTSPSSSSSTSYSIGESSIGRYGLLPPPETHDDGDDDDDELHRKRKEKEDDDRNDTSTPSTSTSTSSSSSSGARAFVRVRRRNRDTLSPAPRPPVVDNKDVKGNDGGGGEGEEETQQQQQQGRWRASDEENPIIARKTPPEDGTTATESEKEAPAPPVVRSDLLLFKDAEASEQEFEVVVEDQNVGVYVVQYTIKEEGQYLIHVRNPISIDSAPLQGSPFRLSVTTAPQATFLAPTPTEQPSFLSFIEEENGSTRKGRSPRRPKSRNAPKQEQEEEEVSEKKEAEAKEDGEMTVTESTASASNDDGGDEQRDDVSVDQVPIATKPEGAGEDREEAKPAVPGFSISWENTPALSVPATVETTDPSSPFFRPSFTFFLSDSSTTSTTATVLPEGLTPAQPSFGASPTSTSFGSSEPSSDSPASPSSPFGSPFASFLPTSPSTSPSRLSPSSAKGRKRPGSNRKKGGASAGQ